MTLSDLILDHLATILDAWLKFATSLAPAKHRSDQEMLLDHARRMLEAIAADLALPESAFEQAEKSQGRGAGSDAARMGLSAATHHGTVPVLGDDGVEAVAGTSRNITDRKAAELRNWKQANFDPLTGQPNRYLFQDRLAHEVRHACRAGAPIALLFVDLDKFKDANDSFGHDAGDLLLQYAAARMRSCVRETDTVARLGGDEFTVILQDLGDNGHVHNVAQKILEQMRQPFHIKQHEIRISASIGIALAPGDAQTPEALMKQADQAMYASTEGGGDRFSFFSPRRVERPEIR